MCSGNAWNTEIGNFYLQPLKKMNPLLSNSPFLRSASLMLTLLAAGALSAQEPEAAPEAPPAPAARPGQATPKTPLIPRAPSRSEWTIRIATDFDGGWESSEAWEGAAAAQSEQRTVRSIEFSKDAELQTYRLRTRWSDGESEDEWIVMGHHVAERAGGRGLYIVGSEATTTQELNQTDFPELTWVDMSSYRGVKAHKGKPVFVFNVPFDKKRLSGDDARMVEMARQSDPTATPSKVLGAKVGEVVLFLDAATQLPVLYNDGRSIRTYSFSPPGEARLRPPTTVLNFLRARAEALRVRLTPPAGPGGE